MIVIEGMMLVPPERGTIIGRALWKPRYVVLGAGSVLKQQSDLLSSMAENYGRSTTARKGVKSPSSKPSLVDITQQEPENQKLQISIYKTKGDWELLAQYPVSAFKSCEIRAVQHRKQSPSLPTLMLEMKPDTPSEKSRKRRSSRTGGLTPKDPWGGILLFRTVQDDKYNIYDWHITVKPYLTPNEPEDSPLSPLSPPFAMFSNPFGSRDSKSVASSTGRPEVQQRPPSQNTYPHAPQPRERPSALISPSPSLRSRRSDLSSQASSMNPPMGFTAAHPQTYSSALPTDLPSPASTSGYDNQFIEGWTSAQGRSSALSSHTRGSNSIASAVGPVQPVASSPPGPRETILDRAFQLRCIPGSDRIPDKDEEQISSIARFEALMREVDERKQNKVLNQSNKEKQDWDLDEESEESDFGEPQEDDDDDEDPDGLDMSDQDVSIPTPAQRALDYISGRHTPLPQSRPLSPARSPPIPFLNQQAMSAFHGHSNNGGLRPRTGTTPSHQRNSRPNSLALPSRSISTTTIPSLKDSGSSGSSNNNLKAATDPKEKRRSSTSVKRLSFTEFAKRLSSTSSLLLVQTNASASSGRDGSRRGSSEYGVEEATTGMRGGAGPSPINDRSKRCGWRGSVGAFGGEGGFL